MYILSFALYPSWLAGVSLRALRYYTHPILAWLPCESVPVMDNTDGVAIQLGAKPTLGRRLDVYLDNEDSVLLC